MTEQYKDHDAICVDIVGKISELGGFKVEFPVYLTCYMENGETYFFVSEEKKNVYDFIQVKMNEEIYCLPPVRKVINEIVSAGQRDVMYHQFKLCAAQELMYEGAGEIAKLLPTIAPKSTHEAQQLMELFRVELKGNLDPNLRQLYRRLLEMAYFAKKINGAYYRQTMEWLTSEEQQMEEERVQYAVHEREYVGFAYYDKTGTINYYTNAVYEATLARQEELMLQGAIVSPIFMKKYCFNDINNIANIINKFKNTLKKYINKDFMRIVEMLYSMENVVDGNFNKALSVCESGSLKERTLKYYKAVWQL